MKSVECRVFRAPITTPLANAFGAMNNRPAVFLRLVASDDCWGWGEVFCNFPQVGAEHRARLVESLFAPLLQGTPCRDPERVRKRLDQRTRRMAIQCGEPGPFAQVTAAVDQALWDMAARRAGVALWKLLGGHSGRVRVYASGLGPHDVVEHALAKRAEGFRAFKLKVGFGTERDVSNLMALRAALGDDAQIMADANQAWTPDEALAHIEQLAPYRPHWIEEPLAADEPGEHWRALASRSPVAVAAGENMRGFDAFAHALDEGWLRFVQPDVGKWGGIGGCRDVAEYARKKNVTCCPHWLGGGIGLAASLHLTAACGTATSYMEVDANPNPMRELVCPLAVDDGFVLLGDAPGLSVEPDLRQLKQFAV